MEYITGRKKIIYWTKKLGIKSILCNISETQVNSIKNRPDMTLDVYRGR